MTMKPDSLHHRMRDFVGEWTGTGDVLPNPWGPAGPVTGDWTFALDHGGFNLIHSYREVRPGGYLFDAHGVLTVDPATCEYVWFWFDNYGFPPLDPSRGSWTENSLFLEKVTPRGRSRSVFVLAGDCLDYRVEARAAGLSTFVPVMRGTFARTMPPVDAR